MAYGSCPRSKAAQDLVLPQGFGGSWQGTEKKKGGREKVVDELGSRDFWAAF